MAHDESALTYAANLPSHRLILEIQRPLTSSDAPNEPFADTWPTSRIESATRRRSCSRSTQALLLARARNQPGGGAGDRAGVARSRTERRHAHAGTKRDGCT